jgi:hypothetical protein
VQIVLKSGSLNLLETSRPVQACKGIALPFTHRSITNGTGDDVPNPKQNATTKLQNHEQAV